MILDPSQIDDGEKAPCPNNEIEKIQRNPEEREAVPLFLLDVQYADYQADKRNGN